MARPESASPAATAEHAETAESVSDARNAAHEPPLVVDLDGTLVATDLAIEAFLVLLRRSPIEALSLPFWLRHGRAAAKRELASRVVLDVDTLPYRPELCAYLRGEARRGRRVVLATANDEGFARAIARHLKVFDRVVASDGITNLKGARKRDRLVQEFGEKGFDYVGDSRSDLAVWSSARNAIVLGGPALRAAAARRASLQSTIANPARARIAPSLRTLRAHHWIKNLLVFVPLVAVHALDPIAIGNAMLAFASFCLVASGQYVFNDLMDLSADRHHPQKKLRPIPAGELRLGHAASMVPALLVAGLAVASRVPWPFAAVIALYGATAIAYSLRLKQVVLLDIVVLASLYMMRIVGGAAATGIPVSRWLLALSTFAFLSLAALKRHAEIVTMRVTTGGSAHLRGYRASDATFLMTIGVASGYLAGLIVALYADSAVARRFYARPELLWLVCPLFVYWISHLWLMAERNRMAFDPVLFAVRDRTSQVLVALMLGVFVLAI